MSDNNTLTQNPDPGIETEMQPDPVIPERGNEDEAPKHRKSPGRRAWKIARQFIVVLALLLVAYIIYSIADIFISPDRTIRQTYLVPKDAVIIIQSSEPIKDWQHISRSGPWKSLSESPAFAEIAGQAASFDSIVNSNKTLLSLVGKRELTISLHKTGRSSWDFLVIVDLQKVSKIGVLKEQIGQVLKMAGMRASERTYNDANIIEARDPQTRQVLYMAFVENHFILSYDPLLTQASIDEKDAPHIGLDRSFIEAERSAGTKGMCRVFINYAYLPQFLSIYLTERNEYLDLFSGSMEYAGLSLDIDKGITQIKGYTIIKDDPDPYVAALLGSGRNRMKAHEIFSSRTALYANIGFSSPGQFLVELEKAMKEEDGEFYKTYSSSREKIESYFGISLKENFLDWMSGEFAVAQLEPGSLGRDPELILAIRAHNIKDAKENMEFIEKRIKRRSPIKIRNVEYKGYPINYIELKGFFRLFFGSLFDKFEKPYYTYIGDYVVLSNRSESLLSFVEDYEQENLLKKDTEFRSALSRADNSSTIFLYADMPILMPLLGPKLQPEIAAMLDGNLSTIYSFPHWTIQVGGDRMTSLKIIADHDPAGAETIREVVTTSDSDNADSADKAMDEDAKSERAIISELKRFHLEKFEGNVMREYYSAGGLQSEQEIRKGIRHGRFREFYEDGTLRARGKYSNGEPKGTWKYYTPEGKFDRKEKF